MTSRGLFHRAGSLLILASLAVVTALAGASSPGTGDPVVAAKAPAPAAPKASRSGPRRGTLPSGHPMPDTVLAVVDGARTVTVAGFVRGWAQVTPPSRPDSLTPESARRFLDLLIDKELLGRRATEETWTWTTVESAQVANVRDRAVMRLLLDSTMATFARERAARGEPPLGTEALGVVARESTVARLHVTYDEALLEKLSRAWAALPKPSTDSTIWARLRAMGQMPVILPTDSGRVVAWSDVGTERVVDLLDAWKKLNPLLRPRVQSVDQVRDLVKNGLFERVLRGHAERGHIDRHPDVVHAVARQEEFFASQYFVSREVYATIPTDEATLRRYYDRDPDVWIVPARLRIVRMVLPERGEAARMAVRLRDAAEADTLVTRGLRQRVDYTAEITAASDSALFAAAMRSGTGTVLGPDSVATGWQVVRVNAVLPARARPFDEVKDLVLRAWSDVEGERRMQALLAGLRKRAKVVVNQPALTRLAAAGIPAPARPYQR